jgi:hypothetical protein
MNLHRSIFTVLLFLLLAVLLVQRIREQLNYGQVHVRFGKETAASVAAVHAIGHGGEVWSLTRREDDRSAFSQFGKSGPLISLRVFAKEGVSSTPLVEEVRIGENWCQPSWPVPLRKGPLPFIPSPESSKLRASLKISEYVPENFSRWNSLDPCESFNWQGDQWLLVTPFFQALVFLLVPWYLYRLICQMTRFGGNPGHVGDPFKFGVSRWAVLGRGLVSLVLVFTLFLALHQLYCALPTFFRIRWGNQFIASLSLISAIGSLTFVYCRRIVGLPGDRERLKLVSLLLVIAGVLKVLWVLLLDSVQTGDYEKYLSYGQQMASGDWNSFSGREYYGFPVFLRRAFVWTYPLLSVGGSGLRVIETTNVILQLLTGMMFLWMVSRMFSLSVACCSLPFLFLYPGFWYATTIVSHNTPGYFWMLAVWCVFEILRTLEQSAPGDSPGSARMIRRVLVCATLGLCLGLLELSKSYNQILLLSLACFAILELLSTTRQIDDNSNRQIWSRRLRICFFVAAACLISIRIERTVGAVITAKAGPFQTLPFLDHILAVDSQTDGSARYVDWWKRDFFPLVSGPTRQELAVRKLMHEKLTGGTLTFTGILLKNRFYSDQVMDYPNRAFGARKDSVEGLQEVYRVPWYGTQRRVIYAVYCVLLIGAVLRCFLLPLFAVTRAELFPLIFCVGGFFILVLIAESCPYYGEIAVFPMTWSTGLVLERFCRSVVAAGGDK